jgi:hypothetical protein
MPDTPARSTNQRFHITTGTTTARTVNTTPCAQLVCNFDRQHVHIPPTRIERHRLDRRRHTTIKQVRRLKIVDAFRHVTYGKDWPVHRLQPAPASGNWADDPAGRVRRGPCREHYRYRERCGLRWSQHAYVRAACRHGLDMQAQLTPVGWLTFPRLTGFTFLALLIDFQLFTRVNVHNV